MLYHWRRNRNTVLLLMIYFVFPPIHEDEATNPMSYVLFVF